MMENLLEYKGYHTKIEFDTGSLTLRGKIEGINDLVNFESKNPEQIEEEFHNAVDDYLEFCKEIGKEPDKEYKGTFNVRITPALHKKLAIKASKNGESLNATVEKAIQEFLSEKNQSYIELQQTVTILANQLQNQNIYPDGKFNYNTGAKVIPYEPARINMLYQERAN